MRSAFAKATSDRNVILYFLLLFTCLTVVISCDQDQQPGIRVIDDFPFDPERKHDGDFKITGGWSQLSDNLFRLEDCCNVYAVKSGNSVLLIDFGSGAILNRLQEIGVNTVERVLVTHHHRDQVQGFCEMEGYPFSITVPAAEGYLFEEAERFWKEVKIYLNYNCRSHWNTIRKNVHVDERVSGGDVISWRGIEFKVINTPGHTDGSVSYLAEIDGRLVAFTGDLIAGAGKVVNWFDLHWDYYGFTQGMDASETSFVRIRAEDPELLLPSHGEQIENPSEAMAENSRIYESLRPMLIPNEANRPTLEMKEYLPHLVYIGGTTYAILSDSGKAFFYDFGYVNGDRVNEFKEKYNINNVDVVSFSHYHDDHNIRTYELRRRNDTRIWIFENMLDIFEHPTHYRLPCLLPFPIMADKVLRDGEKVRWEEYTLEFFYLPGQSEFHQGLFTVIDGQRVMFTGDNTWKKINHDLSRNGPVVPHNEYFLDGGFITCAQKMLEYLPDIDCPAHTEEYSPTRDDLEEFLDWAYRLRNVMTDLIDQPDPNFGMDYRWCRFYPYRTIVGNNEPFRIELMIRNHLFKPARIDVELKYSDNITCPAPRRSFTIESKTQVAVPFILSKVGYEKGKREIITANITINGRYLGEYAEAMIEL